MPLSTPKEFNETLINRVVAGTAYVINAIEYKSLPASLKERYYPLFRRADTTYRLYENYMNARVDIDPNTVSPTIMRPRPVEVGTQLSGRPHKEQQPAGSLVNTQVALTETPLSKKTLPQVAIESKVLLETRPVINVRYSRY